MLEAVRKVAMEYVCITKWTDCVGFSCSYALDWDDDDEKED